ncbi:MAG: hypothetical protein H8E46_03875 [FCB group bacterium]|nr:hypothetical protein [FCB group bacterium]
MENIDEKQQIDSKLEELRSIYQQNENSILGLYRKLESARNQVADCERQIRDGNKHQEGVLREIEDFVKMKATSESLS